MNVIFAEWLIRSESSRRVAERQRIDDRPHRMHDAIAMKECMDAWMNTWMDARTMMNGWMDAWMDL